MQEGDSLWWPLMRNTPKKEVWIDIFINTWNYKLKDVLCSCWVYRYLILKLVWWSETSLCDKDLPPPPFQNTTCLLWYNSINLVISTMPELGLLSFIVLKQHILIKTCEGCLALLEWIQSKRITNALTLYKKHSWKKLIHEPQHHLCFNLKLHPHSPTVHDDYFKHLH